MKIDEVSIGTVERKKLKDKCQRIFNRLVIEDPEFQSSTDEIQNIALVLGFMGLVLGSLFTLLAYGVPAIVAVAPEGGRLSQTTSNILDFLQAYAAILSLALALMVFAWSYKKVSRWAFEVSGAGFIIFNKLFRNQKRRAKLLRMLDIVGRWLQTQPNKVCDAHNFLFNQPAGNLIPAKLTGALRALRDSSAAEALIVRGFAEKRPWPLYIFSFSRELERDVVRGQRSYWREARGLRNAIRVNLVFDVLRVELRDEIPGGEQWRREYRTDHPRQVSALFDTEDLHLRMKTGVPYYRWPAQTHPSSEKETALYRMIMCLENPMRAPIDLISVDDVIDQFDAAIAELDKELKPDSEENIAKRRERADEALLLLQKSDVYMYGKRSRQTLRPSADAGLDAEPVLRNLNLNKTDDNGVPLPPAWQLRWDPNVVDWVNTVDTDGALFRALAILVQAVDLASDKPTKIRLGRGDVLVIDNLRCLVCRREWLDDNLFDGAGRREKLLGWLKKISVIYPDRWWLRGYYGFRRSKPIRQAHGS